MEPIGDRVGVHNDHRSRRFFRRPRYRRPRRASTTSAMRRRRRSRPRTIPPLDGRARRRGPAQTGTGNDRCVRHPHPVAHRHVGPQAAGSCWHRRGSWLCRSPRRSGGMRPTSPSCVLPIYGGQSYGVQLSGLRRGAQVIVGTPGRVIDHLDKGTRHLRVGVPGPDEADEMLTMGFAEDVERILADTPTPSRSHSSRRRCPRQSAAWHRSTSTIPSR